MIQLRSKANWRQFNHPLGGKWYRWGDLAVCVALEGGLHHMSISHPYRYPTWDEIYTARYDLLPDNIQVALILPPRAQYVNVHPNCFHLHEIEG